MSAMSKTTIRFLKTVVAILKEYQSEKRNYSRTVILNPPPTERDVWEMAYWIHEVTKNDSLNTFSLKIGVDVGDKWAQIELEDRFPDDTQRAIRMLEHAITPSTDERPVFDIKTTNVFLKE